MKFDKSPLSLEQQVQQLSDRGLIIANPTEAQHTLSHINYYRLSAYWYPFEKNHNSHEFNDDVNFDAVVSIYCFDRELRLLLLDAIEHIEVSIKTQWAYHMSRNYGSHAYNINNKSLRKNENHFKQNLDKITEQVNNSKEKFIKHFEDNYDDELPPIWVIIEVISLGLTSQLYSNLRSYKVRRAIAKTYQLDETYLEGFLEHITYLRNICAHHGRLWNRHFDKTMPTPKGKPTNLKLNMHFQEEHKSEHKLYNSLVMIQHLMTVIAPESDWAVRLDGLITKHQANMAAMGFPEDWKTRPLWQAALNQQNHKDLNNADS